MLSYDTEIKMELSLITKLKNIQEQLKVSLSQPCEVVLLNVDKLNAIEFSEWVCLHVLNIVPGVGIV